MVAESSQADLAVLQGALEHLQETADGPVGPVIAALQNIVPQYAAPNMLRQGSLRVVPVADDEVAVTADDAVKPIDSPSAARTRTQRKAA
jgi:hypothetical protein